MPCSPHRNLLFAVPILFAGAALADTPPPPSLTLMAAIEQGGIFLWIILGFGFISLVLSLFNLLTLSKRREVPTRLMSRIQAQISRGEIREAYRMCERQPQLMAKVLRAGLRKAGHDRFVVQEAMESEGERGAALLWQRIAYLNNIATLTPLIGLLGTVWGMILAFNGIAASAAQPRDLAMANHITMAMLTTAGGLAVAIPTLCVYYHLRGRVARIVAEAEAEASEFVELLAEAKRQ